MTIGMEVIETTIQSKSPIMKTLLKAIAFFVPVIVTMGSTGCNPSSPTIIDNTRIIYVDSTGDSSVYTKELEHLSYLGVSLDMNSLSVMVLGDSARVWRTVGDSSDINVYVGSDLVTTRVVGGKVIRWIRAFSDTTMEYSRVGLEKFFQIEHSSMKMDSTQVVDYGQGGGISFTNRVGIPPYRVNYEPCYGGLPISSVNPILLVVTKL